MVRGLPIYFAITYQHKMSRCSHPGRGLIDRSAAYHRAGSPCSTRGQMMKQRMTAVVTTLTATALTLLCAQAISSADPPVPQPESACASNLAGALTRLLDGKTELICLGQPNGGYQWKIDTSDYPSSNRWFTYGPELTLHGEGLRNAEIRSGDWIASPLDPDSQCTAVQIAVVSAGVVGPPQTVAAAPGQQLSFQVLPRLFSIQMKGYCLWTKVGS